jgi:hypothetical protein
VLTVDGTGPNARGDFTVSGADCYNAVPRLERVGEGMVVEDAGALRLTNSCSPCCDCSDYGLVYAETLGRLLARAKGLARRHAELRRRYAEYVAEFEKASACRARPTVSLQVTGMYERTAAVVLGFRNNSDAPWPAAPATVAVAVAPGEGTALAPGSVTLYDGQDVLPVSHSFAGGVFAGTLLPIPCCATRWITCTVVWPAGDGVVDYAVSSSGDIDGVPYAVEARGATRDYARRISETPFR